MVTKSKFIRNWPLLIFTDITEPRIDPSKHQQDCDKRGDESYSKLSLLPTLWTLRLHFSDFSSLVAFGAGNRLNLGLICTATSK